MTTTPPPEWQRAFAWVASARDAADSVIDRVRSGELALAQAFDLADDDPLIGRVFAVKVFEVIPDIGKVRARRTMGAIGLVDDIKLAEVPMASRVRIGDEFGQLT